MAEKDQYENTWADQWDFDNETEPSKQKKKKQEEVEESKEEKKIMQKKLEDGLNKTKEGATKGMKKVKDGTSIGFFWIKDKCNKNKP